MSEDWVGYVVSIDCGEPLGTYQGQIKAVNTKDQTLTLNKTFRNGIPSPYNQVTISALEIQNLSIIDTNSETICPPTTSTVTRPVAKRPTRCVSESFLNQNTIAARESPRKNFEELISLKGNENNRTPSKKDKLRQKWSERDEACFGTPIDDTIEQDFDFEKNLALFNKKAVYDEINASHKPDILRQTDANKKLQKYRHDENIIESQSTSLRRIIVPMSDKKEYVTDDDIVVPSILPEMRQLLLSSSESYGITIERQAELMGRAACEMALQLLGGGHRLNPNNIHQLPTVVVLCGSHRQGAFGLNAARQLASHGVKTVVFLLEPSKLKNGGSFAKEFLLYKHTLNKTISSIQDLPTFVDLVLLALLGEEPVSASAEPIVEAASRWANAKRAPVLALDPPAKGTPHVDTKFSLVPILPLAYLPMNGKVYLCNLSLPLQIYKDVGITYISPFGPKFFIPLHPH